MKNSKRFLIVGFTCAGALALGVTSITPAIPAAKPSTATVRPPRPADLVELTRWRLGSLSNIFGTRLTNLFWENGSTEPKIDSDGSFYLWDLKYVFDSDAGGKYFGTRPGQQTQVGVFTVINGELYEYRTDKYGPSKLKLAFSPRGALLIYGYHEPSGETLANVLLTPLGLNDAALRTLAAEANEAGNQRAAALSAAKAQEKAAQDVASAEDRRHRREQAASDAADEQTAMQQRMLMEMQMHQQIQSSIANAIQRGSSSGGVSQSPALSNSASQSCGAPGSIVVVNGHQCVCKATRADGRNHIGALNLPDC